MSETEVTPVEIARIAGVGRAAVSNWRRRYADFPQPSSGTATSPRFALSEVEEWLRGQGKLAGSSTEELAWQRLRGSAVGQDLAAAALRAGELLRSERADEVLARLAAERGAAGAFESLLQRLHEAARLPRIPADLGGLMVALAGPDPETVHVPACGTGALLLAAADRFPGARLRGDEPDPTLRELTRLRLAFRGAVEVELGQGSLRRPPAPPAAADAVLCVPPVADQDWDPGAYDLAYDPRWQYGLPPRGEPELAWVQHALAALRPGGRAVLLLSPAVAARPGGRRIRAELLRRGALRAVIGLPAGAAPPHNLGMHLWLLRRPAPDDTAGRLVIAELTLEAAVDPVLSAVADGAEPAPAEGVAVLPVMDVLDDAVDLTPARRLHAGPERPDPAGIVRLRQQLYAQLGRLRTLLPAVVPTTGPESPSMITIADLAHTKAVTVISRSQVREETGAGRTAGTVPVWRARDVFASANPGGHLAEEEVPADAVRVAAGDVVVPIIGHRLTARVATDREGGALLGANLILLRPDPAMLDPWFLAGFLRRESNTHRAGSLGSVSRYDVRRAEVPRIPVDDQRRYGELFRQLAEYDTALRTVMSGSEDLIRGVTDGLAAGLLDTRRGVMLPAE